MTIRTQMRVETAIREMTLEIKRAIPRLAECKELCVSIHFWDKGMTHPDNKLPYFKVWDGFRSLRFKDLGASIPIKDYNDFLNSYKED